MSKNVNADLVAAGYSPPQFESDGRPKEVPAGGSTFEAVAYSDRPSGYQGTLFRDVATGDYVLVSRGTEFLISTMLQLERQGHCARR
ncbi:hypothetical protein ACQKDV_19510, partial [Stenotrophomonas sp. NPDC077659]